jgi:hypothetical protein
MAITSKTSIEELAALVSQALAEAGLNAVLSGGAAVSIYTRNAYESGDLDFISNESMAAIQPVVEKLGFKREGRSFVHDKAIYFLEFPPGPLAIGDQLIRENETATRETDRGTIRLLSPTQCVMDRLAAFFHWNDLQSLDQAVLVARNQKVSLKTIEAWAAKEGSADKFQVFRKRLRKESK